MPLHRICRFSTLLQLAPAPLECTALRWCRWREYQRSKRKAEAFMLPERSVSSMDEAL